MIEVRFSAAARSDMLDIVVFIARDNPRAAEDWLAAIEERCRNCSGCAWKPRPRPTLKHPGLRGPGNRSITLAPGDTGNESKIAKQRSFAQTHSASGTPRNGEGAADSMAGSVRTGGTTLVRGRIWDIGSSQAS